MVSFSETVMVEPAVWSSSYPLRHFVATAGATVPAMVAVSSVVAMTFLVTVVVVFLLNSLSLCASSKAACISGGFR